MDKSRILVVEDDEQVLLSLDRLLTQHNFEVVAVHDGEAALEHLKEGRFNLVLADIVMEGMDGIELLERAKKIEPRTPVILITGYGSVETVIEALRKDAIDYILKPFEEEELLARIDRVIARQKTGQQAAQAKMYESMALTMGAVAHELNNPLMIISLNAELLLSDLKEGQPIYESVKAIQDAADRMAHVILRMREIREVKTKPYTRESRIADLSDGSASHDGGGKSVLIIDDEAMIRTTLAKALERNGYATSLAPGGLPALDRLRMSGFDYILLDVSMPDMDGYETLLEIKKLYAQKGADIPKVIMMTGYDVSSILDKCLEEGAVEALKKPISLAGVLQVLKEV